MSLELLGYRRWRGRLGSSLRAIWPVARVGLKMVFRQKLFWVLYALALMTFLINFFGIYLFSLAAARIGRRGAFAGAYALALGATLLVFGTLAFPEGPYVETSLTAGGIADERGSVGGAATVPMTSLLDPEGAAGGVQEDATGAESHLLDAIRTAIGELRTALSGDDINEVKAKHENLATASQKLGSALYAQQNEAGQPAADEAGDATGTRAGKPEDDDVVDAEIVDEDK